MEAICNKDISPHYLVVICTIFEPGNPFQQKQHSLYKRVEQPTEKPEVLLVSWWLHLQYEGITFKDVKKADILMMTMMDDYNEDNIDDGTLKVRRSFAKRRELRGRAAKGTARAPDWNQQQKFAMSDAFLDCWETCCRHVMQWQESIWPGLVWGFNQLVGLVGRSVLWVWRVLWIVLNFDTNQLECIIFTEYVNK